MGSTANKLQKILLTKESIRQAIINKGISLSSSAPFSSYASKISEIQGTITNIDINTVEDLKTGWKYKLVNSVSDSSYNSTAEAAKSFNDSTWTNITIPHDWSIYNEFNSSSPSTFEGGYLDGGDSWYRRKIELTDSSKKIYVYFDGVYRESVIYINGTKVGDNKWYNPFYFDITSYLNFDGNDVLAVFVRNQQPSSRWYSGSGIIRNVYLVVGNPTFLGVDNVVITSENLERELPNGLVNTKIKTIINNPNSSTESNIKYTIKFNGDIINTASYSTTLANGDNTIENTIQVPNPVLWDVYNGNLYTCLIEITVSATIIYSNEITYGYRYFKFDKDKGFFLNGQNIKLKGVCMHHDLGCLGAEINMSAVKRQLRILKEMGCNAIRLTHNPSSSEYLNACAEEGILLIEEAFDTWDNAKKTYDFSNDFWDYSESAIKYMVKRGINNPAIIMWSIGNEIETFNSSITGTLSGYVKEIDTTRPVTMGDNKPGRTSLMDYLDVVGINYGNDDEYANLRSSSPNYKLYGSETTSAFCLRGDYTNNSNYSNYDGKCASWGDVASVALKRHMDNDYLAGMFVWTGFDYIGEPTPVNAYPSRSSYFGIVDLAGFPKDIYYMYQSRWTNNPMIHVFPHWTYNSGTITVWLYSNCYKVELFLNGASLGSKLQSEIGEKYQFEYIVTYSAGTLVANGYDSKGNLIAQDVLYTSYSPSKLLLKSDKSIVNKNSDDLIFIECDVLDKNDTICPNADTQITFSCTGGSVVGTDNGNPADVTASLRSSIRNAFHGKCLCVVRPNRSIDDVVVTATSPIGTKTITIPQGNITAITSDPIQEFIDATNPPIPDGTVIALQSITLSNNNLTLSSAGTATLTYVLSPSNTTQTGIEWSVSPSGIVSVSNGIITALSAGTCTVKCASTSNRSIYAECSVRVAEEIVMVENITLSENTISIDNGNSATLTATISPSNATDKTVTWSTNNSNVTIEPNGLTCTVTGASVGESIITAKSNDGSNISATCAVTINTVNIPVNGVSIDKTAASVVIGKTINLTASVSPSTATNKDVTWSVNNSNVSITPNSNIVTVSGITAGTSVVTVTTTDGSYTAECTITVKEEVVLEGFTPILETDYKPNGQKFIETYSGFDYKNQTFYMEVTLDTSVLAQNILSIGNNITQWTGNCIHTYNKTATTFEVDINFGTSFSFSAAYSGNIIKLAWQDSNIVVNGTAVNNLGNILTQARLASLSTTALQIGSQEGAKRSVSTYNLVGFFNTAKTLEEMIELTTI